MENAAQAVFKEKCTLEVKPDLVSIEALMQMQPFQPYLPYPELAISMVHNYESATPSPPATPATPSTPPRPDFGCLDETQKEADPEELYLCFPNELFISSDKVSSSESAAFSNMHTDHETQEYVYDGLDAQDDECMEASQTTLGFAQVPREQGVAPRNAGEGIKGSDTLSNDMDNRKISVENDKILDVPSAPVRQLRKRWSDIEDLTLYRALSYYGDRAWPKVSRALPGRTGKQCRERWRNHLRSGLFKVRKLSAPRHGKAVSKMADVVHLLCKYLGLAPRMKQGLRIQAILISDAASVAYRATGHSLRSSASMHSTRSTVASGRPSRSSCPAAPTAPSRTSGTATTALLRWDGNLKEACKYVISAVSKQLSHLQDCFTTRRLHHVLYSVYNKGILASALLIYIVVLDSCPIAEIV
eukprot:4027219-Pleurochrysis_carterae.AAC.3